MQPCKLLQILTFLFTLYWYWSTENPQPYHPLRIFRVASVLHLTSFLTQWPNSDVACVALPKHHYCEGIVISRWNSYVIISALNGGGWFLYFIPPQRKAESHFWYGCTEKHSKLLLAEPQVMQHAEICSYWLAVMACIFLSRDISSIEKNCMEM